MADTINYRIHLHDIYRWFISYMLSFSMLLYNWWTAYCCTWALLISKIISQQQRCYISNKGVCCRKCCCLATLLPWHWQRLGVETSAESGILCITGEKFNEQCVIWWEDTQVLVVSLTQEYDLTYGCAIHIYVWVLMLLSWHTISLIADCSVNYFLVVVV